MQAIQETEAVIAVEQLVKRYRRAQHNAVDGLSFQVRRGEIFGLLGPNGAGKTTVIGMLTTSVLPTSGQVMLASLDVTANPIGTKQRIAVVPQRNNLDRSVRIKEILAYHAAYHGVPRAERTARANALLEELGLITRQNENLGWLSGGMDQRVMLARALMHEPEVLFLDEPTNNLDPQTRLFLWERIADLHKRGVTIILTTHDMEEADRLCERIAIMDHGPWPRVHLKNSNASSLRAICWNCVSVLLKWQLPRNGYQVRTDLLGVLIGLMLLVALVGAALGLLLGTVLPIQQLALVFALVLTPLIFTGCTFYPWISLGALKWFQVLTLLNPFTGRGCQHLRSAGYCWRSARHSCSASGEGSGFFIDVSSVSIQLNPSFSLCGSLLRNHVRKKTSPVQPERI